MKTVKIFDSFDQGQAVVPKNNKRKVIVDGKVFCLINNDGKFYAVENECPHLGYSLVEGSINPYHEIVCPWHSYRFDLRTGEEAERRCRNLRVFSIVVEKNGVFLVLDQ